MLLVWNELKKTFPSKKLFITAIILSLTLTIGVVINLHNAYFISEDGLGITGYQAIQKDKENKLTLYGELSDTFVKDCVEVYQSVLSNPNNYDEQGNLTINTPSNAQEFMKYRDVGELLTRVYSPLNSSSPTSILNVHLEDIKASDIFTNRADNISFLLNSKKLDRSVDKMHIESPIPYQYTKGWTIVLHDLQYIIMLVLILIAILCSTILSIEHKSKTHDILFISKVGSKKITKIKILSALMSSTFLYFLFTTLYAMSIFAIYGYEGAYLPIQLTNEYWLSLHNMNFVEAFFFILMLGYVSALATLGITLLLSALIKKDFVIISMSLLLILLPQLVDASHLQLFQYIPSALCNTAQNLISFDFIAMGSLLINKSTMQVFISLSGALFFSMLCYTFSIRRS